MSSSIIAYDLGTGGIKASLYDSDGQRLASVFIGYEISYPQPASSMSRCDRPSAGFLTCWPTSSEVAPTPPPARRGEPGNCRVLQFFATGGLTTRVVGLEFAPRATQRTEPEPLLRSKS